MSVSALWLLQVFSLLPQPVWSQSAVAALWTPFPKLLGLHTLNCAVFCLLCCSGFKSRHAIAKFHVCYWWINEITFYKPVENICSWIGKIRILTQRTKLWQLKACGNRCHAVMGSAMHRQHYLVWLLAMSAICKQMSFFPILFYSVLLPVFSCPMIRTCIALSFLFS